VHELCDHSSVVHVGPDNTYTRQLRTRSVRAPAASGDDILVSWRHSIATSASNRRSVMTHCFSNPLRPLPRDDTRRGLQACGQVMDQ